MLSMQRLLACFLGRELHPNPYLMRPREGQLVRFCHSTPGSLWYISVTSHSQRLSNVMDSMQSTFSFKRFLKGAVRSARLGMNELM